MLIPECPIIYCRILGFIPLPAILEQNVCLQTCGVIFGSKSSWVSLYLLQICLKQCSHLWASTRTPDFDKNRNPCLPSITGSSSNFSRFSIIRLKQSDTSAVIGTYRTPLLVFVSLIVKAASRQAVGLATHSQMSKMRMRKQTQRAHKRGFCECGS